MRAIFVSYRRDDSEGQAGRLFDDLVQEFGEKSVFMDIAAIEVGRDFRKAIEESVSTCGVLLAIIGRNWIDAKDEAGQLRLDNPYDLVRLETASALKRDIPVIPVLVHGARMPRIEQLPDDLKELTYRNGVELTHARWDSDLQLLIKALRPHVEDHKIEPRPQPKQEPKPIPSPPTEAASRWNKKKAPWPALAALAIGVVVIGIVGYKLVPRGVTVPDLTGSSLSDATTKLEAAHLGVGRRTYQQNAEKTPDTVLSQSPTPNVKVRSETPIDLVLSHQPVMVEVPSLVGESLGAAQKALQDLHLAVGNISHEPRSDIARNTVLDEFPKPGKKVDGGTAIDLVLSKAPAGQGSGPSQLVRVPRVEGMSLDQARVQLQNQGLSLGRVTSQSRAGAEPNTVLNQSPTSGQQVQRSSQVDLTISGGTPKAASTIPMPNLVGESLEQARTQLQNQDLAVGSTVREPRAGVATNTVLSQSPGSGQSVEKGSRVDLTVSEEPIQSPNLILPMTIDVSCNPQVVSPGSATEITVVARRPDSSKITGAKVTVSAGGGAFVDSGTTSVTGNTDQSGVYRTIWKAPAPAAAGYGLGVRVMKEGFQIGQGQVTVNIR